MEFKDSVRKLFAKLNEAMEKIGDGWRGTQVNEGSITPAPGWGINMAYLSNCSQTECTVKYYCITTYIEVYRCMLGI